MNLIIRDIPEVISTNIKAEADRHNLSQQAFLSNLFNRLFGDPPTVWGYIKFDRPGDLDIGDDCPVCHKPAQSWWLQVCSNGEQHIMCGVCATSE